MKEIHSLNYVHRDLKPDNIVLNLQPLEVKVIDFDRASNMLECSKGTVKGTPGYFPLAHKWHDGITKWDVWALGAIIIECDMPKRYYYKAKEELESIQLMKKHLSSRSTCSNLKKLIEKTCFVSRDSDMLSIDQIAKFVTRV